MRLIKFGTLWLSEYGGEDSYALTMRAADTALRGGSFDGDGAAVWPEARTITRSFEIWNDGGLTIQEQENLFLAEVARGRRLLVAETRDGDRWQTWAKCTGFTKTFAPGDLGIQAITATFRQSYPYWLAADDEPHYLDTGLALDDGWYLDAGNATTATITSASTAITITPGGVSGFARGTLEITAGAGEGLENLRVWNKTTGHEIRWTNTLAAGETLRLDWLTKSAEVNGVGAYGAVDIPANQADWMQLDPGANEIVITCGTVTGSPDLRWTWARHYL